MIASRRPSRRAAATEPAEEDRAEAEPAADAKSADADATQKKPARRRRSRAKKVEAPVESGDAAPEEPTAEEHGEPPAADEAMIAPPAVEPAPEPTPTRRPTVTPSGDADTSSLVALVEQLASEIAGQRSALVQLGAGVDELSARLDRAARKPRLGVFVDVPNVLYGLEAGEAPLDMGKLLAMLTEGRELVRATAYAPVSDDPREAVERQKFVAPFVPYAYRIVTKPMKRFADGSVKGNFDVEMAIDLVTMSERLDVVAIVSGDSDFARAVETVQSRGVRVEVVAFAGSTSIEMRALADHYLELDRVTDQLR